MGRRRRRPFNYEESTPGVYPMTTTMLPQPPCLHILLIQAVAAYLRTTRLSRSARSLASFSTSRMMGLRYSTSCLIRIVSIVFVVVSRYPQTKSGWKMTNRCNRIGRWRPMRGARNLDVGDSPQRAWSARGREGECGRWSTAIDIFVRFRASRIRGKGPVEPGKHGGYGRHGHRPPWREDA
jgi:hypothetical protein